MFASQWFLTLFTARFPLYFVFHILDVFLLQGTETLFQVAIALLKVSSLLPTSIFFMSGYCNMSYQFYPVIPSL